jgi:hypothetical protein
MMVRWNSVRDEIVETLPKSDAIKMRGVKEEIQEIAGAEL